MTETNDFGVMRNIESLPRRSGGAGWEGGCNGNLFGLMQSYHVQS